MLPWLYLKGVSTGDFSEALASLLVAQAEGLSPSTISRLKTKWIEEHHQWQKRSLSGKRYVYVWADGIYFNIRNEDDRQCILVVIGVTDSGNKELLGLEAGFRESELSWKPLLLRYHKGNRGGRRMSRAQVAVRVEARARELGEGEYPSRSTVYRVLRKEIDRQEARSQKRSLGWRQDRLTLHTRDGAEIKVDRMVQSGVAMRPHASGHDGCRSKWSGIGTPWLTIVVDTYSRCVMGIHLGMESPSAWVVCLALRHAIMPKQYNSSYGLQQDWGTYELPQYLYTDGGKDFNSKHIEQVTNELKIVLCQRRYPAEGGIVERPFGTMNSELFATLPGYTGGSVKRRPKQVEKRACLTLMELEKHLVRYIVERYNVGIDRRARRIDHGGHSMGRILPQPHALGLG